MKKELIEERYSYFKAPVEIIGTDLFCEMLKQFTPKPKDGELFKFVIFSHDITMSTDTVLCYYWIYEVYKVTSASAAR